MHTAAVEIIEFLIIRKPMAPTLLVDVCHAQGIEKKDARVTIQIGVDQGKWHFDNDMKLAPGSLWSKR